VVLPALSVFSQSLAGRRKFNYIQALVFLLSKHLRMNEPIHPPEPMTPAPARRRGLFRGLSGKVLTLIMLFIMLGEVMIYVPSIANFRGISCWGRLPTSNRSVSLTCASAQC
jgi:hypothetical protein